MTILRSSRAVVVALLASLAAATACNQLDKLLEVESPSRLPRGELERPENAQLLVQSVAGDFQCALGAYIVAGGLISGEFIETTQTASRWSYDRRVITPDQAHYSTFGCEALGVYVPVSTARFTADNAVKLLESWTDGQVANRQRLLAEAALYAGYGLLLLGEGFCSAAVDLGPEQTPAQLFAAAETRFTKAITAASASGTAAADSALIRAALVGRARSRINRGDRTGAATDAALVPIGFVFNSRAGGGGRLDNRVFAQNGLGSAVTVAPAYRGVTWSGVPDPRVPVRDEGRLAGDARSALFVQRLYTALDTPFPIATGVEARLIRAEAVGGQTAVNIINELHTRAGIPADFASADEAVILAQVVEERRRALFVQGQRLYDWRRFNLPLVPAPGTPYSVTYPTKGGTYGSDRCMPLPDVERLNNPNI